MTDESTLDPELAEIRARRMRELLEQNNPSSSEERATFAPEPLTPTSLPTFLAEHPRVVVDVWAPWCGPCRTLAPVIDALARELGPNVRFGKLNADEAPEVAARFGVEGIPTQLVFDRGRLVDRIVGAYPHEAIDGRLRRAFGLGGRPSGPE
jgi:thioredoxin 1